MIVKRIVKFNIKKSHPDFNYIKLQLIESKEIYNFANYILRQLYFKNSNNHKYSLEFINEYPSLKDLFLKYKEISKSSLDTSLINKEYSEVLELGLNDIV